MLELQRVLAFIGSAIFTLFVFVFVSAAQAQAVRVDTVEVELLAERTAVVPGETLRLGLFMRHDPQWHTYWRNPGDSGLPTQFPLTMPDGFAAGPILWPWPTRVLIPPLANIGYGDDVLLMREVTVPESVAGDSVQIDTLAQWLVCREVCVPGEARLSISLPVADDSEASASAPLFSVTDRRLPAARQTLQALLGADQLSLSIPADLVGQGVQSIEYFSFTEGFYVAAADQAMVKADNGWRLDVDLAKGAPDPSLAEAAGVLVINNQRAIEIAPQRAQEDLAVWRADGERTLVKGKIAEFMLERQDPASSLLAAAAGRPSGGGLLAAGGATGAGFGGGTPTAGAGGAGIGATMSPQGINPANPTPAADGSEPAGPSANVLDGSLLLALGFAIIGGLILNLMPCVFPVIGLKILGFAGQGGNHDDRQLAASQRASVRRGSAWFAAGVVVSFWVLAAVLLSLRGLGESVGWGFQLQSPGFVMAMALLFLVIGLNFSGVFEFGAFATRLGALDAQPAASGGATVRAFFSGVLAVLVATPCTAPFMGSAIGFTLAQPPLATLAVFTALGLGMALPYILLGVFPQWLRWLPRPGRWMETLKQFLAFPMYAAAAWLAWVLAQQAGADAAFALLLGGVFVACGLWVWGRQVQGSSSNGRWGYGVVAAVVMLGGVAMAWPGKQDQQTSVAAITDPVWQPWSAQAVKQARAGGNPVFVDFTAAWCVSCQVNKKLVFDSETVRAAFKRVGMVQFRADWTNRDPAITEELASHGRNSVPLYLLYLPGNTAPILLPELLTTGVVLEALKPSS